MIYRIVASSKACYLLVDLLGNQHFVKRSQYTRVKNTLHKQSEKAYKFF